GGESGTSSRAWMRPSVFHAVSPWRARRTSGRSATGRGVDDPRLREPLGAKAARVAPPAGAVASPRRPRGKRVVAGERLADGDGERRRSPHDAGLRLGEQGCLELDRTPLDAALGAHGRE